MDIQELFISPGHNYFGHYGHPPGEHPMLAVDKIHCVEGSGIEGDRFFNFKPDYKGQVTFFEFETYLGICNHFNIRDKSPSVFRRNVITRGVNLNSLIGKEFEVLGVRFLGATECAPCEWMNRAFCEGAETFLKGRGGLRAKILSSGILRKTVPLE
jgi:MOSC domain-containing protein YiiM